MRASAALLLVVAGLSGCSGGGGGSQPGTSGNPPGGNNPPPGDIPAPTNVVATAGYHTVHLSWNAVAGATSYDVFVAGATGNPIAVSGTSYDATGLPNWVSAGFQIAAVVSGVVGTRSATVNATPTAGYLVGFREDPANRSMAKYQSDVAGGAAIDPVDGGTWAGTLASGAVIYQVAASPVSTLGGKEIGIYTAGATRVTIAAQPGHYYRSTVPFPAGTGAAAAGRWLYLDATSTDGSTATSFAVRSNDSTGAADRLLLDGCTAQPAVRASRKGALISCPVSGHPDLVWATDGLAPAVNLPGTTGPPALLDYFPGGALLVVAGMVYHAPVDGSAVPQPLSPETTDMADVYYSVSGPNDEVLIVSHTSETTSPFRLWSMHPDGSFAWSAAKRSGSVPTVFGPSGDGTRFLALLPNAANSGHSYLSRFAFADGNDVLQLTAASSDDLEGHFLSDGAMVVKSTASTTPWRLVAANATGVPASPATTITTVGAVSAFLGFVSGRILFDDQTTGGRLWSLTEDLATINILSTDLANSPHFAVGPKHVAWLGTDGHAHIGLPDGTVNATLDPNPSNGLQPSGLGPGDREFWIVMHATGEKDTLVFDTATGQSQAILGGATSDSGWFVP